MILQWVATIETRGCNRTPTGLSYRWNICESKKRYKELLEEHVEHLASIRKAARFLVSNSRAPKRRNMVFSGTRRAVSRNAGESEPSIVPAMRKCSSSACTQRFSAAKGFRMSCPYLGPGSAGHFVKMVHNGIEYGVMQLLAETYDLMKRGLGLNDDEMHVVYVFKNE